MRSPLVLFAICTGICCAHSAVGQGRGPTPVEVAPLEQRDVPDAMRLVGTVRADRRAVVATDVEGIVAEFVADEGDFVEAGQVICRLDPEPAELRLAEAAGELARLEDELLELRNGARAEVLTRLRAAVGEAEAMREMWSFERDRIRALYESRQANDKERQDAESEYAAAERRLAQRRAELAEAENGARPEQIARAEHAVAAQQAVVGRLQRDVQRTRIQAPFDGFVVTKASEAGEWLDRGGAVCELVAIETVRVRADAPERVVPYARVGAEVTLEFEALGASRTGRIARLIPSADPAARTFPLEIDLENADHTLLPGMFAWTHVPAGAPGARLLAPKDAIVAQGTSKSLYVLRASGEQQMAMPVPVTTGLEVEGLVAVEGPGLAAGALVVIRANERLFGPTPVLPTNLPPAGGAGGSAAKQAAPEGDVGADGA